MESIKFEAKKAPPMYEVDLTEAWNSEAEADMFIEALKSLGLYSPNLRFSGFNADDIGNKSGSDKEQGMVFCAKEADLYTAQEGDDNALKYALDYDRPAVAIYDGLKLEGGVKGHPAGYRILDGSALIAIVKLKT